MFTSWNRGAPVTFEQKKARAIALMDREAEGQWNENVR